VAECRHDVTARHHSQPGQTVLGQEQLDPALGVVTGLLELDRCTELVALLRRGDGWNELIRRRFAEGDLGNTERTNGVEADLVQLD